VLEVASAHIVQQVALIDEERRRFGADVDRAVITPGVVARTLREYAEADRIVVTSSFVRRTFVERGVPESRLTVVPYGIDPAPPPLERPTRARPRILFVGGCSLRKGIPYLFDAFRRLDAPAELRLVGRPNTLLFRRLGGLPRHAVATGPLSGAALAAEYADADVFVLPSVEDGFGLVTLEAMRAGLPVIVSENAGSAEVVRDGDNGFVVPARDAATLAERLDILLKNPAIRRGMGAEARATAEGRTWETYGQERQALIYGPLLSGSTVPGDAHARAA
jgi:glycosyltransferase involved in cell wall biosynthesis